MRTRDEIEKRIAAIEADERMKAPSANIVVNAPLALIQLEGESVVQALRWALGKAAYCARSYASR